MPDPLFPHTAENRFPLPGVIKLDPLCPPPNAEPLDFMLAVMRDKSQPCGGGSRQQRQPHPTGILMTLVEIPATFPVGSDERLEALAAWRQAQDRLAVQARETKPPTAKLHHVEPQVAGAIDKQRREWEDRNAAAERQREAEAAAAIRARVTKAVD